MTSRSIPFDELFYDSFCNLRTSIDVISCASHLIPEGGEDEDLGHLFRILSERCQGDLTALFSAIASSNAKSGVPCKGSDLVIDDTPEK